MLAAACLSIAASARAQEPQPTAEAAPPAHIAFIDGSASLDRDGVSEPALANAPFEPGDRLRTVAGRVEVLFPDGTALDVDQFSAIEFLSPTLFRLEAGRILLVVAGVNNPAAAVRFQVDTPAVSTHTDGPGEYRVTASQPPGESETECAVLRGSALVTTDRGSIVLVAGQRTVTRAGDPPQAEVVNSARYDDFDLWTRDRRDARVVSTSAEYLPEDLRVYGATFDQDGSWEYMQPYGYVWYPAVTSEWRPYYHGHWKAYRHWGWTWVGNDPWSWPTHHYGRWGMAASRWYWIPGRSWAPAWVSWASAPGYVSWCPLGFDGRPAVSLSTAHRWSGWTAMPRHTFTSSGRVDRFAASPQTIPTTAAFAVQRSAPPQSRAIAVPRNAVTDARVESRESRVESRESRVGSRESKIGSPQYAVPRASAPVQRQTSPPPAVPAPTTVAAPTAAAVPRGVPTGPAVHAPAPAPSRTYSPPPPSRPPAAPAVAVPATPRAPAPAASPAAPSAAVPRAPAPAQAVPRAGTTPAAAAPARPAPAQPAPRSSGGAARKQ